MEINLVFLDQEGKVPKQQAVNLVIESVLSSSNSEKGEFNIIAGQSILALPKLLPLIKDQENVVLAIFLEDNSCQVISDRQFCAQLVKQATHHPQATSWQLARKLWHSWCTTGH
jgi:hypothetical protein